MRDSRARVSATRALAITIAACVLALTPLGEAQGQENPSQVSPAPSPQSATRAPAATDTMPEDEPSAVAVEEDAFAADGYLGELLVGSAAAITVLLVGGYLMRRG